jgi:hypothetical protein
MIPEIGFTAFIVRFMRPYNDLLTTFENWFSFFGRGRSVISIIR